MSERAFVSLFALPPVAIRRGGSTQYPLLDQITRKVIQKYQQSTCEQLWQRKSKSKSAEEKRVIDFLRSDPQMRTVFISKVTGPIANKMFECGMIP